MNKTVNINIGGRVFHIDEEAFEVLKSYLSAIKQYFDTQAGKEEIIADIETRIGELFQELLSNANEAITMANVNQVIATMGSPAQLAGADGNDGASFQNAAGDPLKNEKRLFRDPDDKVIGGVCAGVGAYFGVDPVWIRLALAIAFFVYGSGFLLYIILWISMPIARNTAEKLQMRGEAVNLENIQRTVKQELNSMGNQVKNWKQNEGFSNTSNKVSHIFQLIINAIIQILSYLLKVLAKVFSILAIIIAVVALVLLFCFLFGSGFIGHGTFGHFAGMFIETNAQKILLITCTAVLGGIPLLLLLYKGISGFFNIKVKHRALNISLAGFWLLALFVLIFQVSKIGNHLSQRISFKQYLPLSAPTGKNLVLAGNLSGEYDDDDEGIEVSDDAFHNTFSYNGKQLYIFERVQLQVAKAENDQFALLQINRANGPTRSAALAAAKGIRYKVLQHDSVLEFNSNFDLVGDQVFRNQNVKLRLLVPVGKSIYFKPSVRNLIYDIKNVTNTFDGDMIGRTWLMTTEGLKCTDCNDKEKSIEYDSDEEDNLKVKSDIEEETIIEGPFKVKVTKIKGH